MISTPTTTTTTSSSTNNSSNNNTDADNEQRSSTNKKSLKNLIFRKKAFQPREAGGEQQPNEHQTLEKSLSLFDLISFGVGSIIGAGIFVLTGVAAANIAGPSILISFLFDGFACTFTALCYSELASRTPTTGSAYSYTYIWIGEFPAFLVGWGLCLEYGFAVAAVGRGLSGYFWLLLTTAGIAKKEMVIELVISHSIHLKLDVVGCALSICVMLYLVFFGTKSSSTTNAIITILSVIVIVFVIAAGAFFVDFANFSPFAPFGIQGIFHGAAFVFFSFLGFDSIATLSEEVENGDRNVPLAIIISLSFCSLLYASVSFVITGMIPYQLIDLEAPLAAAFASKGLAWAGIVITIGAFAGLITTMLTSQMSMTRLLYAVSRDGLLPTSFSQVKNGVPFAANIVSGTISATLALFLDIQILSGLVCAGTLAAFVVVCFSVLYLRINEGYNAEGGKSRTKREMIALIFVLMVGVSVTNTAFVYYDLYWPSLFLCLLFIVGPFILICKFFLECIELPFRELSHRKPFLCPFVPVVPLFGVAVNVFMFVNLSASTLLWFLVWLGIGAFVYLVYGVSHSKVGMECSYPLSNATSSFYLFSSFSDNATTTPSSAIKSDGGDSIRD